jgi:shikimate O-hydroxycinnamoyltransferase
MKKTTQLLGEGIRVSDLTITGDLEGTKEIKMTTQLLGEETQVSDISITEEETQTTNQTLSFTKMVFSTIKPIQKTHHVETIYPTSLDLNSADSFVPLFFAYRLVDNSESCYTHWVEQLKESLQKVLVPFFSFAGRWIDSPVGSSSRKLLCNDEGVPFVEAYLDRDLDSVVHASAEFQPIIELQGYDVLGLDQTQYRQEMQPGGLPCIFVQSTRFKCGGVVLAVTFNHMHTDGKGCLNFMKAWSDLSRTKDTTVRVEHNRSLAESESVKNFLAKRKANETPEANGTANRARPTKLGLWAMKHFEVNASTIQSLKQEAKAHNVVPGFVSTVDCIIAHLWKALARLSSSIFDGREISVAFAVEGRSRFFDPPLPNLCGNAVAALVAPRIPASQLQEMPVSSIASKLREKIYTTTKDDWLSMERLEEALFVSTSSQITAVRATSWLSFPMYDIDFGFGKPFFALGLNSRFKYRGLGTIYIGPPIPSSISSGASVSICSTPELLAALQLDSELLQLFLPHRQRSEREVVTD